MKLWNRMFGIRDLSGDEREALLHQLYPKREGYNDYFGKAGIVFRVAEFAFLFMLIAFLVISVLGNLSGITYANAEYLFRNFAVTLEENRAEYTELIYNPDTGMSFSLAGKGLSVCGNTGISLFSATGRLTCTDAMQLSDPCIRSSSRYTLVFESGGTSYYVYGPYSRLYAGITEYPIRGGSIAENGSYVLISGAEGYTSAATVFDSDFSPVTRYLKNGYLISAELNREGTEVVLTVLDTNPDGSYTAEISRCTPGKDVADFEKTVDGVFPLRSVLSGNTVFTVCNDRLLILREDGSVGKVPFPDGTLSDFSISDGYVAVLVKTEARGKNNYAILTAAGDASYEIAGLSAQYCTLASYSSRALLLTEEGIRCFEDGILSDALLLYRPFSAETRILAYQRNKVYLAGKSAAYVIEVD